MLRNVYKMGPGFLTHVVVRLTLLRPRFENLFNATDETGYVYHCHILDREDSVMMQPLELAL
ncbi:hypothetical protein QJS10_CPA01g00822 [Acorus calamus]|uniref:Plastocyanin-like domain-containing protein n=1 Tax=Acorus calamus TaxID=4465 RepID=A0AAV9FL25_ACOCL|nr:hypothetical protein QJS10_CPA01g00822 [Acorus calamus]